MIWQYIGI